MNTYFFRKTHLYVSVYSKKQMGGETVLSKLDMSRNFTLERIRELAGHARESVVMYTHYFYTISDLEGISDRATYEEVVDFKMARPSQAFESS